MSKLRVAVLRGGPSNEYDVSLKTGASVLRHMPEKYQTHDILIATALQEAPTALSPMSISSLTLFAANTAKMARFKGRWTR
jgi:D-alanine-D-alanine ligase-like ATP-grasp enzyme